MPELTLVCVSVPHSAFLRVAAFLLIGGNVLTASQHWIRVATPHFEMFTTNNEKQATRALQTFEQVRYFFLQNNQKKQAPDGQVRIIAFSSEKDFKPYRMNGGAFAYYLQSRERDYIVMQDIEAEHHEAAVHEYTHLIVQHLKLEWPIWLNEGFADLYSSLEPRGKQAMVGRALPSHVAVLSQRQWMDWKVLFAVDHNSPFYNEREKMQIFYSQSWMLTHMLALSQEYMPKFSAFLLAVSQGASTADSLQKVYGKSVDEVAKDVLRYSRQASYRAGLFDVTLSSADLNPQTSDLPPFNTDLALADLLAGRKETQPEARKRLLELSQQNSQSTDVEESLGYLAWQAEDLPEARKHFSLAVERGSKNVRMIYDLAGLSRMGNAAPESTIELLRKVIALQPDHNDARILLAEVETSNKRYASALQALAPIHSVTPEQAYRFFGVSAFTNANLHNFDGARQLADKALPYAKTPTEKGQMEELLQWIDRAKSAGQGPSNEPATETKSGSEIASKEAPAAKSGQSDPTQLLRDQGLSQVAGTTKTFECGKGSYRLHLNVQGRVMVFDMPDPKNIVVNVKELLWNCGTLPPREVTVIYRPSNSPKSSGTVSELVFRNPEAK